MNFNYFISEAVFCYLLDAVHLVAEHGWKLLPDYVFDPATAIWRHRRGLVEPPLRLHDLRYDDQGRLHYQVPAAHAPEEALAGYLDEARELFAAAPDLPAEEGTHPALSADFESLRWFLLPSACLAGAAATS
jgi:hypothetical protein